MAKKTKSRYELKEKLGEGGMGVVWRAFDTALNTDVALKMLLDANDATALQLFYEECHKQSALAHPNIVEVRDVGTFDEDGLRHRRAVRAADRARHSQRYAGPDERRVHGGRARAR